MLEAAEVGRWVEVVAVQEMVVEILGLGLGVKKEGEWRGLGFCLRRGMEFGEVTAPAAVAAIGGFEWEGRDENVLEGGGGTG